jgi:hypothetical protein
MNLRKAVLGSMSAARFRSYGEEELCYGISVSRVFVSEQTWQEGGSPFLNNVREESIPA